MFKTQLKAILMASAYGNVSIMFPLIISLAEVKKAKEYLEEVKDELKRDKVSFDENIKAGIMIETPAAALMADELAKEVDFFSVGSNDLTQYTLAVDRCNASVDEYNDKYHPAVLKLLEKVSDAAHKSGIKVGICGELASDVLMTKTFIEMGYDTLSVSISKIGEIASAIRDITEHK